MTGREATADCTCWTTSISDTDEAVAACPVHRKAGRMSSRSDYGPRWFCWFRHRWTQGPPWNGTHYICLRCGRREDRRG